MGYGLGVDVGTSSVAVAVLENGRTRMLQLDRDGVTAPAPQHTGPAAAVQALTASLQAVVRAAAGQFGSAPDSVVLTYPTREGQYGRDLIEQAARQAGLEHAILVSDLQAAAGHYAAREGLPDGALVLVYQLGSSVFSTAVAQVAGPGVLLPAGSHSVKGAGGADLDGIILGHVDRALHGAVSRLDPREPAAGRALDLLRRECERAKEVLTEQESTVINVLLPDATTGSASAVRQSEVELSRGEFESLITEPLEWTLDAVDLALGTLQLTGDDLAGVLLIGGSAPIPLVSRLLSGALGVVVPVDPEAGECAALGAARLAAGDPTGQHLVAPSQGQQPITGGEPAPGRNRRTVAAAVVVALLVAGAAVLAFAPGHSGGPASSGSVQAVGNPPLTGDTPDASGSAPTSSSVRAATPSATRQRTIIDLTALPTAPISQLPSSAPARSALPSAAAPTATATASQSPASVPTSTPSAVIPASPSSVPTFSQAPSQSPSPTRPPTVPPVTILPSTGLIVRVGGICYDIADPNKLGQFPIVPCS